MRTARCAFIKKCLASAAHDIFGLMGKKVKVTRVIDVTELGRAGGKATAANRTPDERKTAAQVAAAARWAGHVAKRPASSRNAATKKVKEK